MSGQRESEERGRSEPPAAAEHDAPSGSHHREVAEDDRTGAARVRSPWPAEPVLHDA